MYNQNKSSSHGLSGRVGEAPMQNQTFLYIFRIKKLVGSVISVLQLMSLVEVLKGDRAERSLSEKTLKWELSSLNLASFSARLDSEDGLGDNRLSICSFLVIGAEMLVRFELMASDSGSGSSPSSNSDVSTSTFSLLHRVTLWRMNLIMSCRGKFV